MPASPFRLLLAVLLAAGMLQAQSDEYVTNSNLRGVVPLATYQIDEIDNVNLGNGAVNLTIGLFSRQGRGPGYSQTVYYSSKIWKAEAVPHPLGAPITVGHNWVPSFGQEAKLGGVRGDLLSKDQFYECEDGEGFFLAQVRSNFIYTSAAGGTHRFPNRDYFTNPEDELRVCGTLSSTSDYPVGPSDSGVIELDTSQTGAYLIRFKDGSQESFITSSRAVTGSNGNIRLITDHVDNSRDRVFRYDFLNRLDSVAGLPWFIDYAYDRFGNRLSAEGTVSTPNYLDSLLSFDAATNRVLGWEYDSAGNLLDDGLRHYWRDGEGRITGVGPSMPSSSPPPGDDGRSSLRRRSGAPSTSYLYDYQGRRAAKLDGSGGGRIYFWDEAVGEVIWEFPLNSPIQDLVRGWFNGRLVVENDTRPGGGLHNFFRDHLGSTQVTADFFTGALVC
ncbi:MAG TPA: hypothetical protein VLV83_14880, partial [Acidobacteriota bacterium]|nr:hypothetical protein [Acidobacteriota bacterium]